jgi:hypothetical protein
VSSSDLISPVPRANAKSVSSFRPPASAAGKVGYSAATPPATPPTPTTTIGSNSLTTNPAAPVTVPSSTTIGAVSPNIASTNSGAKTSPLVQTSTLVTPSKVGATTITSALGGARVQVATIQTTNLSGSTPSRVATTTSTSGLTSPNPSGKSGPAGVAPAKPLLVVPSGTRSLSSSLLLLNHYLRAITGS